MPKRIAALESDVRLFARTARGPPLTIDAGKRSCPTPGRCSMRWSAPFARTVAELCASTSSAAEWRAGTPIPDSHCEST
ncbi:hypothetical protein [Saccharopolyspora pogona]|uniref:hypothetical protein n=1 Tax=Saccharopolyspora pogona TaxID=333966 RepID=UPI001CC23F8A|nr:hypothetical protein [Saccharopolyspora pogona]